MTTRFTILPSAARVILPVLLAMSLLPSLSIAQTKLSFGLGSGYLSAPLAKDLATRFNANSVQEMVVHPDSWAGSALVNAVKGNEIPFAQVPVASFLHYESTNSLSWLDPQTLAKTPEHDFLEYKRMWRHLVGEKTKELNLELLFLGPEIPSYRLNVFEPGPEQPHWTHIPIGSKAAVDRWKEEMLQGKASFRDIGLVRSEIPFHAVIANGSAWASLEEPAQEAIMQQLAIMETLNWHELQSDAHNVGFLIDNGINCLNCMPGQDGPWNPPTPTPPEPVPVPVVQLHSHKHIDHGSTVVHDHHHDHPHHW